MKVLMVGPARSVHGGISAVVNEFYEAGLGEKIDLKYIGTMKEGSRFDKLIVAGCAFFRFVFALSWADVVHIHFSSDSSFVRKSYFIKAAKRHGKKIVLHQHGGDFKTYYGKELDEKGRRRVRKTLDMGDIMLVLTDSWKEFFSGITDPEKIEVFPNGIRTEGREISSDICKDYNKILFLGRICKDKGIDELLEAAEKIHDIHSDARLYIGGIYEDQEYKRKIEASGRFCEYIGWISGKEKEEYLDKCGILVLPSYYEGFPVSIIEAMFHNSSVIASRVGGIPDIIDDGQDGLLISPKDSDDLRKAIDKLICDNDLARKLGVNGQKKVLEKYSVEENIKRLIRIYSKLCGTD